MSGGVLLRAASWFALVVTAASAGYSTTQRLVSQSTAAGPQPPAATAQALAAPMQRLQELRAPSATPQPELTKPDPNMQRPSVPALHARSVSNALEDTDRNSATKHKQNVNGAIATNSLPSDAKASETGPTTLIAERVRSHDGAARLADADPDQAVEEPDLAATQSDPLPAAVSGSAPESTLPAVREPRPKLAVVAPKPLLSATRSTPVALAEPAVRLPLAAAARIDGLAVNGSVSSANVRHGVERMQSSLTGCYEHAAHNAGQNHFSTVRVLVLIDEAGRVKTQPTVVGAQLPGLDACLSAAFSRLVCRAPDTGTARAAITLRFGPLGPLGPLGPQALAAASRVETR